MAQLLRSETSDRRASRISPDFYHRPDRVQRFRFRVVVICTAAAVGYLLFGFLAGSQQRYSHGPVVAEHAGFESNCKACHVDFRSIRDDAWAASWTDSRSMTDINCNHCHPTAGHHTSRTLPAALTTSSCTLCHFEHKGRDADITRVADQACLSCHEALDRVRAHRPDETAPIATAVRDFSRDGHPEFRSLVEDSGTVKFDHAMHLTPGIVRRSDSRGAQKLSDLSEQHRATYRRPGQSEADLVQLDCNSCHEPDYDVDSERAEGAFMKPIAFERHCVACHSLNYQWTAGKQEAPHGLTYRELTAHFKQKFSAEFIAENPDLERTFDSTPKAPGRTAAEPNEVSIAAAKFVQQRTSVAMQSLKLRCVQCHDVEQRTQDIVDATIPQRWLEHGRFNHRTHRAVKCAECHPQGAVDQVSSDKNVDQHKVMILGRDKCIECHKPGGGAARHACVNCHRYHVDHANADRAPAARISVSELMEAIRE